MPSRQLSTVDDTNSAPSGPPIQHLRTTTAFITGVVSASVALLLLFVLLIAVLIYRRRRRKGAACRRTAPSSPPVPDLKKPLGEEEDVGVGEGEDGSLSQPQRFTYDQLRRATGCFALSNKVGQGGFGSVFRGAIQGGKEIAAKLMDSGSFQGEIEFQNELSLAASVMQFEDRVLSLSHVVFPLGFCEEEDEKEEEEKRRKKRRRKKRGGRRRKKKKKRNWFDDVDGEDEDDEDDEDLDFDVMDGVEGIGRKVLILVYEFMQNGSLQDALLVRKRPEMMEWRRRFAVVVDVAKGLQFLHTLCNPPIIHGDIKPSNVLLDSFFSAKIADFGLARPLTPALVEASSSPLIPFFSGKLEESENGEEDNSMEFVVDGGVNIIGEATVVGEATVETESGFVGLEGRGGVSQESPEYEGDGLILVSPGASSPMTLEVASTSEVGGFDKLSMDSGPLEHSGSRQGYILKNAANGGKISGKDWWWPQDREGNSESGSRIKDYVMEWIGSEIGNTRPNAPPPPLPPPPPPPPQVVTTTSAATIGPIVTYGSGSTTKPPHPKVKRKPQRSFDWWNSLDVERLKKKKEKTRPAREWWREEYTEELARKKQKKQMMAMTRSSSTTILSGGFGRERQWWQKGSKDFGIASDGWSGTKKSRRESKDGLTGVGDLRIPGRRSSHDWANGDIPKSGGVSSTPSMRGTMCYSAPEAGGETLSEKCDIYSFGVLLLVIISGRRPLQVTASPMSEFERANLISWARHLARKGKLFDLVDSSVVAVDREQALLCIRIALVCLQRSPACRPSIDDIVHMLSGTMDPPHLPMELSSHQGAFLMKSRKKAR